MYQFFGQTSLVPNRIFMNALQQRQGGIVQHQNSGQDNLSDSYSIKSVQVFPTSKSYGSEQLQALTQQLNLVLGQNCDLENELEKQKQINKDLEDKMILAQQLDAQINQLNKDSQQLKLKYQNQQQSIQNNKQKSIEQQQQHKKQQISQLKQQLNEFGKLYSQNKSLIGEIIAKNKQSDQKSNNKINILNNENKKLKAIIDKNKQQRQSKQMNNRYAEMQKLKQINKNLTLETQSMNDKAINIFDYSGQINDQQKKIQQCNLHIQGLQNVVNDLSNKIQILCEENDRMSRELDLQQVNRMIDLNIQQEYLAYIRTI